jgi:hypothetical protein
MSESQPQNTQSSTPSIASLFIYIAAILVVVALFGLVVLIVHIYDENKKKKAKAETLELVDRGCCVYCKQKKNHDHCEETYAANHGGSGERDPKAHAEICRKARAFLGLCRYCDERLDHSYCKEDKCIV